MNKESVVNYKSFFIGIGVAASFFLGTAFQSSKTTSVGYIETEKVMQQMPEAKAAQEKLQKFGEEWQKELNKMKTDYEEGIQEYERKKSMMNDSQKKKKEEELLGKQQRMQEYYAKKTGKGGELEQKQLELYKPLEEKIMKAVEKIAEKQGWNIVLTKGGIASPVLYGAKQCNITYDVMKEL